MMSDQTHPTKERLLLHAQRLIWSKGYSNVPLRDIAKAAGVDVALISRYFGGKLGLFEATLTSAMSAQPFPRMGEEALIDFCTKLFIAAPRDDTPSFLRMILMNAHDEAVADKVKQHHQTYLQSALEEATGSKQRAALFISVMLGISVAERSLALDGIAPHNSPAYEAQVRHMLKSALAFKDVAPA